MEICALQVHIVIIINYSCLLITHLFIHPFRTRTISLLAYESVDQSVGRSVGQSVSPSVSQLVSQSIS